MTALAAINKRLEAYQGQIEPWNHENAEPLGEAAYRGMFIYDILRKTKTTTFVEAHTLYSAYLWWYKDTLLLVRSIEKSEQDGFEVEFSESLKSRFREANAFRSTFEERIEALGEFIGGRGIPAKEFLEQL